MKKFFTNIFRRNLIPVAAALIVALTGLYAPIPLSARDASHYSASSRLVSGKWVKVKVEKTGVQFVSAANLRKMGFSDPSKVRVFGLGGRELPETLTSSQADDLPRVASVADSKGVRFFGYDYIRWDYNSNGRFDHKMHSYAEESWYFLTDSDTSEAQLPSAPAVAASSSVRVVDSFIQPLLHEQDLYHPSNTGSRYLGEDFRSPTRRSFDFTLTDAVEGENCYIKYGFGANTSSASTVTLTAGATDKFESRISAVSDNEQFMRFIESEHNIQNSGNSLRVEIQFQGGGNIRLARLDYLKVQYRRKIRLADDQLYFTVSESRPAKVSISGGDASVIVWDVTEQGNPMIVATTKEGNDLTFMTPGNGLHEYVAFNPDKAGYQVNEYVRVSNQDIHSLPIPDMLIIAPATYREAANKMANHHRNYDKMKVQVLTPEEIYNEFSSGTPDVTAFRRLLKMWYDRGVARDKYSSDNASGEETSSEEGTIRYCLIMGEATFDQKRLMEAAKNASYPFVPIRESFIRDTTIDSDIYQTKESTSYCTDDYIGMLADVSGTFYIGRAKMQVAVGRMPFQSASEALSLTDKYINYVENPTVGAWRNRFMFIADDLNNGVHLTQSESMISELKKTAAGKNFRFEKLYLDSYPQEQTSIGPTYPKAKEKMMELWNSGVNLINYIGHANPVSWTHENLLNWTDITSFSNENFPFIYAATCEFGRIDADTRSGAEVLWAYPNAGIIGILTPARTVYIDQNGNLTNQMGKSMLKPGPDGRARTIGEIMIEAKNNYPSSDNINKLKYVLIGNPAMRMQVPTYNVALTSLGGRDVEELEKDDLPVVTARSNVNIAGEVRDLEGNLASDFNGLVEIQLYDAEKTVETLGNGADGVISYYNDRKTLLYRGVAKAEKGRWQATAVIPSEIENNYSPAQFVFYAYTPDRTEANGQFSDFYVYGRAPGSEKDFEGPQIEMLALNREDFQDGQIVHSSPVVMAKVSDESGINISDAGIGHAITLVLDDKTYYTDVNSYYTPDTDDFTGGSITYPLSDVAPGKHSLKLIVWDTAKNSSSASIDFEVAVAKAPEIYSLSTDVNPARDHVNFTLSTDRPKAKVDCRIEVFDLNGRRVWSSESNVSTDLSAGLSIGWNLCDGNGVRVPRGIYVYRATVISPEGPQATKSYKLAVTAP